MVSPGMHFVFSPGALCCRWSENGGLGYCSRGFSIFLLLVLSDAIIILHLNDLISYTLKNFTFSCQQKRLANYFLKHACPINLWNIFLLQQLNTPGINIEYKKNCRQNKGPRMLITLFYFYEPHVIQHGLVNFSVHVFVVGFETDRDIVVSFCKPGQDRVTPPPIGPFVFTSLGQHYDS